MLIQKGFFSEEDISKILEPTGNTFINRPFIKKRRKVVYNYMLHVRYTTKNTE